MLLPAAALKYYTGSFDAIFIQNSILTMFIGGSLFLANYGKIKKHLYPPRISDYRYMLVCLPAYLCPPPLRQRRHSNLRRRFV